MTNSTLILAGHFRMSPQDVEALRPAMQAVIAATRAEDGCLEYGFAQDVLDAGVVRIFEIWRDQAAHQAHDRSPHLADWLAARGKIAVLERRLIAYEVASSRPA